MGGSSSQPHTKQPMSLIHAFPTEDMYSPEFSNSFQHIGSFQRIAREDSPVEVAAPPPKSKPTRGRQKRTIPNKDAPRQTAWKNEEEIVLCKGWIHVSKNSKKGNASKDAGFWTEVLQYIESKTKAPGRRTYDMINGKWKMEDLKGSPKWMDTEFPKFLSNPQVSKRYKTSGSSSFNTESGDASINMNVDIHDDEEDEVQELRRPIGRDKAKGLKKKGPRSSGSSSNTNDEG
ncbi:hypothetical protein Tco_0896619 [Tanacetum coccineum]